MNLRADRHIPAALFAAALLASSVSGVGCGGTQNVDGDATCDTSDWLPDVPAAYLEDAESLATRVQEEASQVFHQEASVQPRRAFVEQWVYAERPVVTVDADRFRFVESVGAPAIAAALHTGERASARRWYVNTALSESTSAVFERCFRRSE